MDVFWKLYSPLFSSLLLLVVARRVHLGDEPVFTIAQLGVGMTFNNTQLAKLFALFLALWPIPYYVQLDFTEFFPKHLRMSVFYDQSGIARSLEEFDAHQLANIGYRIGNERLANIYYDSVDQKRAKISNLPSFFSGTGGMVHSAGETNFIVKKISGFQNYHIEEVSGSVTHTFTMEGERDQKFVSFFERTPSRFDYIRPSLGDIFLRASFTISPMFKQKIAEYSSVEGESFQSSLLGLTRVYLLPVPSYGDSVYFFDDPKHGAIPVAYALYE